MSAHRILELEQVPGLGCSPIKAVRELGSERRETIPVLSGAGAGYLRGAVNASTRGPGWTVRWWTGCHANGTAGSQDGRINAEGI